jgi:hypothetical protein
MEINNIICETIIPMYNIYEFSVAEYAAVWGVVL